MTADSARKANILIVDDTIQNLQLLTSMLERRGYEARPVPNGKLALQAVDNDPPDLILLDINMPQMNGYEVCRRLKAQDVSKDIPVIFISALNETVDKVIAFEMGGVDYVTKPFQLEEVIARVETHLALRRAQLELKQSYSKLRELEQLRDNLVQMIVHDMRSPLAAVLASICFLKEDLEGQISSESMNDMDAILAGGERLNRMANDLLDVSRLEEDRMPLERADCDLAGLVKGVVEDVKSIESDRVIHVDASGAVPIACDEKLVRRTVENLLSNGRKHTPSGRTLWVSVSKQKDGARITVRDEGAGIPEEFREKIFEKFGTLDARNQEKYHAIGLGLAFCKLAVEAHGGKIGVDSEGGTGSTFWFTLPSQLERAPGGSRGLMGALDRGSSDAKSPREAAFREVGFCNVGWVTGLELAVTRGHSGNTCAKKKASVQVRHSFAVPIRGTDPPRADAQRESHRVVRAHQRRSPLRRLLRLEIDMPGAIGPLVIHGVVVRAQAGDASTGVGAGIGLATYGLSAEEKHAWSDVVRKTRTKSVRHEPGEPTIPRLEQSGKMPAVAAGEIRHSLEYRPRSIDDLKALYVHASRDGAFVRTGITVAAGDLLKVVILHPLTGKQHSVRCVATRLVEHEDGAGVTIVFDTASELERQELRGFVEPLQHSVAAVEAA